MKKALFLLLLGPCFVFSNPENGNVILGEANIAADGKTLNILCGDKTIINWESFSIGKDETTNFHMPSASSAVLNKVIGNTPSSLLGTLLADGRVFLLNPHGIIIGKDAYINVASFLASTLDLIDGDFAKNGELLFKGGSKEALINLGKIESLQGDIALIGRIVKNAGTLNAKKGSALLAAGKEVLLKLDSSDKIFIRPELDATDKMDVGIENSGQIEALRSELKADGNVYALAIKDSGSIDALGFQESGGEVFLVADGGTIEFSGKCKALKDNSGGEVVLSGKNIGLLENGVIDVSAGQSGGQVFIGGNRKDNAPNFSADYVYCDEKVKVSADALDTGNGGQICFLGESAAIFKGEFSVKGGLNGGDGGLIEVSSFGVLAVPGTAYTKAFNGRGGYLLLDPYDITINTPATSAPSDWSGNNYTATYAPNNINNVDLQNHLASGHVVISTGTTGLSTDGTVTFVTGANVTWSTPTTLTVNAAQAILLEPGCTITNNDPSGALFDAINFTAAKNINIQGGIVTKDGNVKMQQGGTLSAPIGISVGAGGSIVTSGKGSITLTYGDRATLDGILIGLGGGSLQTTGTGAITLTAQHEVLGGLDIALIDSTPTGASLIQTTSGNIALSAPGIVRVGNQAQTQTGNCFVTTTTGAITCNAKNLQLYGGAGASSSSYIKTTAGGDITINSTTVGSGSLILQGGTGATSPVYIESTGTYIFIDTDGASGFLTLNGGTGDVSYAKIQAPNGYIYDDLLGNLTITAGTGAIDSSASISAEGMVRLAANNVVLTAGPNAATSNEASIVSTAGEVILVTTGNFTLTGGASATTCDAYISAPSNDVHVVNDAVGSLTLTAPSGGLSYISAQNDTNFSHLSDITLNAVNADAYINGNGSIDINNSYSAPSGKLTLQSGVGSAHITSGGNIVINTAGGVSDYIKLLGGTGASSPSYITTTGAGKNITINNSTPGAGFLTFTGGSGATSYAKMSTASGAITCKLLGDNTITAGTGATDSSAGIFTSGASGNITLTGKNFTLIGGSVASATSNQAVISSASGNVAITSTGSFSLTGGAALTKCDAYISAPNGSIIVTDNSVGSLTLTAPNSALAYISSNNGIAFSHLNNVTLNATNADAYIKVTGSGDININSSFSFPPPGSLTLQSGVGSAYITGGGIVEINTAGNFSDVILLHGGTGTNSPAYISASSNIEINLGNSGLGNCILQGGSGDTSYAKISTSNGDMVEALFGDLTISAGTGSVDSSAGLFAEDAIILFNNNIVLTAGPAATVSNTAAISSTVGDVDLNIGGSIALTGGASAGTCDAYISALNGSVAEGKTSGGPLSNLTLSSPSSGHSYISAQGRIDLESLNDIMLNASGADAYIKGTGSGDITINSSIHPSTNLTLQSGIGSAYITGGGNIVINTASGASDYIELLGGTGINSPAYITTTGAGKNININVSAPGAGFLTFAGGSGDTSYAKMSTANGAITCKLLGDYTITAGTGAIDSSAGFFAGGSVTLSSKNLDLFGGSISAANQAVISSTSSNVTINASGNILLTGGMTAGCDAYITAPLGTINMSGVDLTLYTPYVGQAYISCLGQLTIDPIFNVTLLSTNAPVQIYNTGGSALLKINASGNVELIAGTSSLASINATGTSDIDITANSLSLFGGGALAAVASVENNNGNINCTLGGGISTIEGDVGEAFIKSDNGNIDISNNGILGIAGGTANAFINAPFGTIDISGGDLILFTPDSGLAYIESQGQLTLQNLSFLSLNAVNANAYIDTTGGSLIDISTDVLSINGGSSATNTCNAYIFTQGDVICDVGDGPSNMTGGSSTQPCRAQITGLFGTVSMSNTGLFTIEGGSSTNSGAATINSFGEFTFFNSGILTLQGGSVAGGQNFAKMTANSSDMILNGGGVFNFYGGSADGCFASAFANGALLLGDMYVLLLQGSDSGVTSAYADISSSFGIAPYNNETIGNLTLIGGNGTSCSASIDSIDFVELNVRHDISLVGGTSATSDARIVSDLEGIILNAGGDISLHGDFANITAFGDVQGNAGGDIILNGSNALNPVLITSQTGSVSLTAGNDVDLINSSKISVNSGELTVIAGHDISIDNGSSIVNPSSGNLTLVVDNDYPVFPDIGHGSFTIKSGGTITAGGPLRIFTALREFNDIEELINGVPFNPGPFGVDSQFEQWDVYFPNSFWGGLGYTIFYKSGTPLPHLLFPVNAVALSELMYLLNSLQIDFIILDPCYRYIKQCKEFTIKYRCPVECRNLNMRVAPL